MPDEPRLGPERTLQQPAAPASLTPKDQEWIREVYQGSSESIDRGNSTAWESMLNKALGMMLEDSSAPSPIREAFSWLYQWAGAMNAPVSILDNLSALAQGEPVPHEWQYPAMPDEAPAPHYEIGHTVLTGITMERKTRPWLPILERWQSMSASERGTYIAVLNGVDLPSGWMVWDNQQKAEWLDQNHPLSTVDK